MQDTKLFFQYKDISRLKVNERNNMYANTNPNKSVETLLLSYKVVLKGKNITRYKIGHYMIMKKLIILLIV
jgi:hypothetical protein